MKDMLYTLAWISVLSVMTIGATIVTGYDDPASVVAFYSGSIVITILVANVWDFFRWNKITISQRKST